jgi:hypothetical protein
MLLEDQEALAVEVPQVEIRERKPSFLEPT